MDSFMGAINVREFVWRCMLAQWIRGMCWRMLRYADYVDGMSKGERKAYRCLSREGFTLEQFATACVNVD